MKPGPRNLITDVEGFLVGNAADAGLKSGTTVLTAEQPFTAAVHVMGGAPGTRETDLLAPDRLVEKADALVLSGGSAFGLDAASGVADALAAAGRGFEVGAVRVPIVPAAILFDLLNGGDKDWTKNPYRGLGWRAFEEAGRDFALGTAGAGAGATTANLKGGLGSASLELGNGVTVGALAAANPVGSVTVPGSRQFWAAPFEIGGEFGGAGLAARGAGRRSDLRREARCPGARGQHHHRGRRDEREADASTGATGGDRGARRDRKGGGPVAYPLRRRPRVRGGEWRAAGAGR